jgi:(1->4)-alpha-D-glucan 1-alpha-D-glucosylmutase
MAKGVEDTAFHIDNRLVALNEVGGDPATFGSDVAEFHRQNEERLRRWPFGMLLSSTHDTKRSEDVRARIAVLSEMPDRWRAAINRWARLNRHLKTRIEGAPAPDRNDEYLFYQTLLGIWPWGAETLGGDVVARLEAFMLKAARESQRHTSWISQHADYEGSLTAFVRGTLDHARRNPFLDDLAPLRDLVAHAGAHNALSQQLLKLTSPGMPDLYQGTELWEQSLVDPDNRRPVDFTLRQRLLRALRRRRPGPQLARDLLRDKDDGRIKLFLTTCALRLRAAHPDLFLRGDYLPLAASGDKADHVVAFSRRHEGREVIVIAPRLIVGLTDGELSDPIGDAIWGETCLPLPDSRPGTRLRDQFTNQVVEVGGNAIALGAALAHFPCALLLRTPSPPTPENPSPPTPSPSALGEGHTLKGLARCGVARA